MSCHLKVSIFYFLPEPNLGNNCPTRNSLMSVCVCVRAQAGVIISVKSY